MYVCMVSYAISNPYSMNPACTTVIVRHDNNPVCVAVNVRYDKKHHYSHMRVFDLFNRQRFFKNTPLFVTDSQKGIPFLT